MDEEDYCWYCGNDFLKDGLCPPCKEQDRDRQIDREFLLLESDDEQI